MDNFLHENGIYIIKGRFNFPPHEYNHHKFVPHTQYL